ncbi:hypothetical protein [Sporosarcina sp. Marseille-Q4943]|uniref:hypothetical protein n=1 Tax=Sporosarcina sp. Marseille-Q4943 TaxID=2942204 RepID=UPI00208DD23D|nr:hypothetical protein [Sporosarcina sp. Marseille-Q4943]
MDQANYQNEILQAISELSLLVKGIESDLKETRSDLKDLQTTVDSNHKTVMERIDFTEDKLSEEIRKVDRKMLILTNELLETKADVLRIEQTK